MTVPDVPGSPRQSLASNSAGLFGLRLQCGHQQVGRSQDRTRTAGRPPKMLQRVEKTSVVVDLLDWARIAVESHRMHGAAGCTSWSASALRFMPHSRTSWPGSPSTRRSPPGTARASRECGRSQSSRCYSLLYRSKGESPRSCPQPCVIVWARDTSCDTKSCRSGCFLRPADARRVAVVAGRGSVRCRQLVLHMSGQRLVVASRGVLSNQLAIRSATTIVGRSPPAGEQRMRKATSPFGAACTRPAPTREAPAAQVQAGASSSSVR